MSSIETIGGSELSRFRFRRSLLRSLFNRLAVWSRTRQTRRQLSDLSDAALKDLGLSREAALQEATRPFWDIDTRYRGGR
ncbi:DUF1127 domain-containing protein [Roseibium aggregatum]|uniref:DUF1127 domain-containing protein n=1 Tax=Roseibium aggregatum TaxID=187304 RepID=A0A939J0N9_9HYPH|nr:DUF1127 domain-containing protein [Roseibium aggregatum]MBN9671291.1 DUF1127 domain-containing protein [Roseibium aggregatum]